MHWEQFPRRESYATSLLPAGSTSITRRRYTASSIDPVPCVPRILLFETRLPLCQSLSFSLFLLSSSPRLHVAQSVSQQSGASGPLRLRLPPPLSKAETRHCCRHCGYDILAAVVGFRQPALEQNTTGAEDTWEQKRGKWLIPSPAVRREEWTSPWQGHSLEFMRCSSSRCPSRRAWEGGTNLWNGMM